MDAKTIFLVIAFGMGIVMYFILKHKLMKGDCIDSEESSFVVSALSAIYFTITFLIVFQIFGLNAKMGFSL